MNDAWLKEYRSKMDEIKELEYDLAHLAGSEILIGNSVILDYRKGYPQPQSLVGYDHKLETEMREKLGNKRKELLADVKEIEDWIEAIPDSVTRRCFRMVYKKGMSQQQTAMKVGIDQSRVSRKINNYLKTHKKPKKT